MRQEKKSILLRSRPEFDRLRFDHYTTIKGEAMTIQNLIKMDSTINEKDAARIEMAVAKASAQLLNAAHKADCGVVSFMRAVVRVITYDVGNL